MPFKKGASGNKHGKPKGANNKVTKEMREILKSLVEKEFTEWELHLSQIKKPEIRLKLLIDLLPYVLPKLQNTNLTFEPPASAIKNVIRFADGTEIEI